MRFRFLSVLLTALLCPAIASAWGPEGHRIIAILAQRELTPQAAAQVADLLNAEPDPSLAGVANWADTLREQDPARFKQTQAWHYVDLTHGGCSYVAQRDCADGNCVTAAIDAQRKILADASQPRQARVDALKFLVHFVGDVHQPFHASSRDDRGGNEFQISLRTGIQPQAYQRDRYSDGVQGTNLHAVWDYYIIAQHDPDPVHYASDLAARARSLDANAPPDETASVGGPADWTAESCRIIGSESLYPSGHRIDSAYLESMRPVVERRLLQAGHRLAETLNAALGSAPRR